MMNILAQHLVIVAIKNTATNKASLSHSKQLVVYRPFTGHKCQAVTLSARRSRDDKEEEEGVGVE